MIKILGSLFLLGGAVLSIYQQRLGHRRRRSVLTDLISVFYRMKSEISVSRTPLPQLLCHLSAYYSGDTAVFLQIVAGESGEDFQEVWRNATQRLPISMQEKYVIEMLGICLNSNEENACKAIEVAIEQLEKHVSEWDKLRPEEERRAAALCVSGAALLVILLI